MIKSKLKNFTTLNDVLKFIQTDPDILLRTHTSSVQVRYMENNTPPIRTISYDFLLLLRISFNFLQFLAN